MCSTKYSSKKLQSLLYILCKTKTHIVLFSFGTTFHFYFRKRSWGFSYIKCSKFLKHFAGTFHWVQTLYFWRVPSLFTSKLHRWWSIDVLAYLLVSSLLKLKRSKGCRKWVPDLGASDYRAGPIIYNLSWSQIYVKKYKWRVSCIYQVS